MSVLRLDGVTKSFGGFMAVDHVSLQIAQGEMRGLLGSNGAGKSTLLHLIYGQLNATSGTILFDGSDVTRMAAPERAEQSLDWSQETDGDHDGEETDGDHDGQDDEEEENY